MPESTPKPTSATEPATSPAAIATTASTTFQETGEVLEPQRAPVQPLALHEDQAGGVHQAAARRSARRP
jgi:hypothetical protein